LHYNIYPGNRKGKKPLGKYRHKWTGDIAISIKEMVQEGVQWSLLAHLEHGTLYMTMDNWFIKGAKLYIDRRWLMKETVLR
jgi:hypothetical protein